MNTNNSEQQINSFQFPLWDTEAEEKPVEVKLQITFNSLYGIPNSGTRRGFSLNSTFNSLYGILQKLRVYSKNKDCFQFPLWDTTRR